ncbi:hypothetical protein [Rummeliibacillus stabekisii]|uniref:hypothetical protein n=1 Tax=Rummeliibacillus stabekisii TaxID=241244 RepID=UPI003717CBA7
MANSDQPLGNMIVGLSMNGSAFNNSLNGIKRELKVAQSALKANLAVVSQAGDEYATLEAKIEGMSNVVKVNARQIDILREKHKKAIETYGEGSEEVHKLSNQINNAISRQASWEKQINQSREALSKMDKGAKESKSAINKLSSALDKTGEKAESIGSKLSKAFTAPLIAIGGMSSAIAIEMDKIEIKIQGMVDTTKESVKDITKSINNIASKGLGGSKEQIQNVNARVRSQTGLTGKDAEKMTQQVLQLTMGTDYEDKEIVDTMNTFMKKYDMTSTEASNRILQLQQIGLDDLDQAREYLPLLKDVGFNPDQFAGAIQAGVQAGGWNTDKIQDFLKEGAVRIFSEKRSTYSGVGLGKQYDQFSSGKIDYKTFLEQVQKATKGKDIAEQKQMWAAVSGTQGEDIDLGTITAIVNSDGLKVDSDGAKNLQKAIEDMPLTKFKSVWADVKQELQPVGDILLDFATKVLPKVSGVISKAGNWFGGLSTGSQSVVVAIGMIMTVLPGLIFALKMIFSPINFVLKLFGKFRGEGKETSKVLDLLKKSAKGIGNFFKGILSTGLKVVSKSIGLLSRGLSGALKVVKILAPFLRVGLGAALRVLTGPIGWVITGISLLTSGFKYAYKHSETFRNFVDKLKNTLLKVWNKVKSLGVKKTLSIMWSFVKSTFKTGVSYVSGKLNSVVDKIKRIPSKISHALASGKSAVKNGAKKLGNGIIEGIEWGVNKAIGGVNWVLGKLGSSKHFDPWEAPKFAKGTGKEGHTGGLAHIGDGNKHELVQLPNGKLFLSPNKDTLVNLPKGTHVLSGNKTEQLMSNTPKYANGTGWLDSLIGNSKTTFNKVKDWGHGIIDWVKDKASIGKLLMNKIGQSIPNMSSIAVEMAKGGIKQIVEVAKSFLFNQGKSMSSVSTGDGSTNGVSGNIFSLASMLAKKYGLRVTSGYRPGSLNELGQLDDHAKGKAIDIAGNFNGMWEAAKDAARYPFVKYVINRNMWTKNHGLSWTPYPWGGHMNHTHISAFANGGLVTKPTYSLMGEDNKPEMIIPLSNAKRTRGLQLLNQASSIMGVKQHNNNNNSTYINNESIKQLAKQTEMMQQQIELLTQILAKKIDFIVDGRSLAKVVESYINKEEQRKNRVMGRATI